ncbi:hypothetical protein LZ023_26665 [Pseudomonas silvicola]|nr:hypothetical protein LZ023_26665 [Pseudomonas silvicola]
MSQFKAGDLALLIGVGDQNNFKTVELVEFMGTPEVIHMKGFDLANTQGLRTWWVRCEDCVTPAAKIRRRMGSIVLKEFPVAEKRLIQLRGDFTPEQQKAKEAEPCL